MKQQNLHPKRKCSKIHAKAGAQIDMLVDANKSADDILKKVAGTSRLNTSVIAPGKTPLLLGNQSDVLTGADKSVDDISEKGVGTFGPNASIISPGSTRLGKKALEKPSAISK
jgi:hypothetical protein